jgi:hypothetical protein
LLHRCKLEQFGAQLRELGGVFEARARHARVDGRVGGVLDALLFLFGGRGL